jgi:hypothetical protein
VFPLIEVVFNERTDWAVNACAVDEYTNGPSERDEILDLITNRNVHDVGCALGTLRATSRRDPLKLVVAAGSEDESRPFGSKSKGNRFSNSPPTARNECHLAR